MSDEGDAGDGVGRVPEERDEAILLAAEDELWDDAPLSPRWRKVAAGFAALLPDEQIAESVDLAVRTVQNLKRNKNILREARRLQDLAFATDHKVRMRGLIHETIDGIENVIRDPKHRGHADMLKWLYEQIDGKAVQKHEVTGGILVGLIDRLDSMKIAQPTPAQLIDPDAPTPLSLPAPPGDSQTQEAPAGGPQVVHEEQTNLLEFVKRFSRSAP